jgi:hypothetical protein
LNFVSSEVFDHNRVFSPGASPSSRGFSPSTTGTARAHFSRACPRIRRIGSNSGTPTLAVDGVFLHSRYDPIRDATRAVADSAVFTGAGCVFAGIALAYVPELYAARFPDASVILVEPDIYVFYLCLEAARSTPCSRTKSSSSWREPGRAKLRVFFASMGFEDIPRLRKRGGHVREQAVVRGIRRLAETQPGETGKSTRIP